MPAPLRLSLAALCALVPAAAPAADPLRVALVAPQGMTTCGVFQDGRSLALEHGVKCRLRIREGRWEVALAAGTAVVDLIEGLEFGPEAKAGVPSTPGVLKVTAEPPNFCWQGDTCWRLSLEQEWTAGGEKVRLQDSGGFYVRVAGGVPDPKEIVIDERRISQESFLFGHVGDDPEDFTRTIRFSSCEYADLPLWEVRVATAGGYRALLHQRYEVPFAGSGPAQIVRGEVRLGERLVVETSYWRLVYAAEHHNWNESYWVLFPEPIEVGGTPGVRGFFFQEGFNEAPRRAGLIGGTPLAVVKELEVLSHSQTRAGEPVPFRRGETRADGVLDLTDAVAVFGHLFLGGAPPDCLDAADADDSGEIDLTDGVAVLLFLFMGGDPPGAPYPGCGDDPTPDALGPCDFGCPQGRK